MDKPLRLLRHLAVILILPVAASAQTSAADVIEIRVVPGWTSAEGTRFAALHIRLAPGWKTYWRLPGAAGIPPEFDWSESGNVADIRVHWPQPSIFDDYGVRTIGYADEVYLPLEVIPERTGAPVRIAADASLGVCREVCLPVGIKFATTLPDGASADATDVGGVRAALSASNDGTAGRGDAACRVEPIQDGMRVSVKITGAADIGDARMVFIRPGREDIWVSDPEVMVTGGTITASADLVPPEAKPFALDRSAMRFTLLGASGSADLSGCEAW